MKYPALKIIQFTKAPVVGQVKTRLVSAIGEQRACQLHKALTHKALSTLVNSGLASVELHSNDITHSAIIHLAAQYNVKTKLQKGCDLGERMNSAIQSTLLLADVNAVILVGSDCPDINFSYIKSAIQALSTNDIVIGPAMDGGYVLIAMSAACPSLFENIQWGSSQVLNQTLGAVKKLELSVKLLNPLSDIDRVDDLPLLKKYNIDY